MKKRTLSLVLAVILTLSLVPVAAAANYTTDYSSFSTPGSSDYAYWNGSKVVRGSGTTTSEVKWMQAALNWCIKNKGLNASYLDVDGSFGPASQTATKAFQRKYSLSVDGSFGPSTIAKMKEVLKPATTTTPKPTPTPAPTPKPVQANYTTDYSSFSTPGSSDYAYWNGSKVVRDSGTTTSEVKWMQAALNYCIKNKGLNASYLDVDGSFGPASQTATKAFQRKYGLSVDGSFGPSTIAKMKEVLNPPAAQTPDPAPSTPAPSTPAPIPSAITFSIPSLTLAVGESKKVDFSFTGEGIQTLYFDESNQSVCTAEWGSIDWNTGTGSLIVTGRARGSVTVSVGFADSNGQEFFSRGFRVKVDEFKPSISLSSSTVALNLVSWPSQDVTVTVGGTWPKEARLGHSTTGVAKAVWLNDSRSGNQIKLRVSAEQGGTGTVTVWVKCNESVMTEATIKLMALAPEETTDYDTGYDSYSTPDSSDYAYWNGSKSVLGTRTTISEVKWMQAALNYCIKNESLDTDYLDVDGSFGPASKAATKAFQQKYGLSVDGSFGPGTITRMKKLLGIPVSEPEPSKISSSGTEAIPYNAWVPVSPTYTNAAGARSAEAYNRVIDQFDVEHNGRYTPFKLKRGDTYCNIFAWDVSIAMGAEIAHWVGKDGKTPKDNNTGTNELGANATYNWLKNYGKDYGWRAVSAKEAQERANQGYPTVGVYKNNSGGAGHLVMVRPETQSWHFSSSKGPVVAQAGSSNFDYGYIRNGYKKYTFYTHD